MRIFLVSLLLCGICVGEILRLSKVGKKGDKGVERMEMERENVDGEKEVLYVFKETILTEMDVKHASVDPIQKGVINIRLSKEGGAKMIEATKVMKPRRDRIAIIVEGELLSAPVVNSVPLGSSFLVEGLDSYDEADALARKIMGNPRVADQEEEEELVPVWPELKRRPFTDEEMAEARALQEKAGIFALAKLPTEEELDKALRKELSREEMENIFGPPSMTNAKKGQGKFYLIYRLADENIPERREQKMAEDGFKVQFEDGKVVWWSHTWSNRMRPTKVVGLPEPTLDVLMPDGEMPLDGDLGKMILWVESIEFAEAKQLLNRADYGLLFSLLSSLSMAAQLEDDAEDGIKLGCDYMKLLASEFPEMKKLKEDAVEGRVPLDRVKKVLKRYWEGSKLPPNYQLSAKKVEEEQKEENR